MTEERTIRGGEKSREMDDYKTVRFMLYNSRNSWEKNPYMESLIKVQSQC